ncbi:MAG: beta-hydroxyacyl-ACP dehydratase [Actinobacteria bacterium]|nr:beta-hydroxyacyl-ACP dehydratase [Actinomycetota bacterium]
MREHVAALLPQGHPMVLVDRVDRLEPGDSIEAIKAVTASEPCFARLDQGCPSRAWAYPFSLVIESFGQAAALLWLSTVDDDGPKPDRLLMFAAARGVEQHAAIHPGDVMRHVVRLDHVVGDNAFVTGHTQVGYRLVASFGSMVAVTRPTDILVDTRIAAVVS